jgi:hypothetical protein
LVIGETRSNDGDVSSNHGSRDIWVVNIDSTGNLLWERAYGGTDIDYWGNIIPDLDGNYYFVAEVFSNNGDIQSGNHGVYDVWVVKIDGTGEIIWEKCYGGSGYEASPFIKRLSNGNLLISCGSSSSDGDVPANYGVYDAWIFVISPSGEIIKSAVFGNDLQNEAPDAIETQDGGFFLTTFTSSTNGMVEGTYHGGMADVWALKLDSNLTIEWQMLYGGSGWDSGTRGILEVLEGYVFLASTDSNDGDVSGYNGGFRDIWVVRIDLEGNIIWQRCLGGSDSEYSWNLLQTENDGFMIFGYTSSNNGDVSGNYSFSGWTDIWMVKLSSSGELEWQQCFGSYGKETVLSGVIKKSDHNWVIAGSADYNSNDVNCNLNFLYVEDYWVFEIKDTTTGFNAIPATVGGLKVYPNPARDYVVFELNEKPTNSIIQIVNVFGEQVESLLIKAEKTVWDTRDVQSGIYFYKLEIASKVISGKIVLQ